MAIDVSIKNDRKKNGKTPVRETEVWSLPDRVKNLNAGVRRLSIRGSFDGPRTPVLKLLPSESLQIQGRGTKRGEFSLFFLPCRWLTSDADVKKKNPEFAPFRSAPLYLWRS